MLNAAATAHFLSFGHRLIYQTKVFDLLDAAGDWEALAEPVLCGHLAGIVNGTREDLLPGWAAFRRRLAEVDVDALYAASAAGDAPLPEGLVAAVRGGRPAEAFAAVVDALAGGCPPERVVDGLSLAAADRLLWFDPEIDWREDVQDGWLSVSHIQTHAAALRVLVQRWADPRIVPAILHGARMANHHRVLDLPPEQRASQAPAPDASVEGLRRALWQRQPDAAVRQLGGLLRAGGAAEDEAMALLTGHVLSDVYAQPIVSAHALKNLLAAADERAATGSDRPVLGAVRMLAAPLRQRWTHRAAVEGVALVTEGRIPRLLAP